MKVPAFTTGVQHYARGRTLRLDAAKIHSRRIGCTPEEYVAQREANNRWCRRCSRWLRESANFKSGRVICDGCRG